MQITLGRRLYYNKITGVVIYDTGERVGENIVDTTIEDDFKYSLELRNQNPEIVGYIQLEPEQYNVEFSEAVSYRVNPESEGLEFGYEVKGKSGFYEPYKDQIAKLEARNKATEDAVLQMMLEGVVQNEEISSL